MSANIDGRPPGPALTDFRGLGDMDPALMMRSFPVVIRKVLFKKGIMRRGCVLCGSRSNNIMACEGSDEA